MCREGEGESVDKVGVLEGQLCGRQLPVVVGLLLGQLHPLLLRRPPHGRVGQLGHPQQQHDARLGEGVDEHEDGDLLGEYDEELLAVKVNRDKVRERVENTGVEELEEGDFHHEGLVLLGVANFSLPLRHEDYHFLADKVAEGDQH